MWPNGEFSVGWAAPGEEADSRFPQYKPPTETHAPEGGIIASLEEKGESPLGLALGSNSHKKSERPETYGRKGITGYGKKMIRSGAALLQRTYGRRRLSFLTLTLPPIPGDEMRILAERWGELTRQLLQYLGRRLKRAGLPTHVLAVSECQPQRAAAGLLNCLHIHAVFVGWSNKEKDWAIKPLEIREWFLGAIGRLSGYHIPDAPCENLRAVWKSAEGYLGKYMSKGSEAAESLAQHHDWQFLPRQWWNMSSSLRKWIKKETYAGPVTGRFLEQVIDAYFSQDGEKFPGMLMAHHIELSGFPFLVGYSGRFSKRAREDVQQILKELVRAGNPDSLGG